MFAWAERRKNEKIEFRAQIFQADGSLTPLNPRNRIRKQSGSVFVLHCFQHLRALRHCALASPATAPPGAKRSQKAKKPTCLGDL